ncbi:MAG: hypothetical protein LUG62_05600 [Clostridiales bacterium]|nr:hypothetical protein [Clostridiales bacterium]
MIIRSQNKNIICCFGVGCVIWIEPFNSKDYSVKMAFSNDNTRLGDYGSRGEATAVIEDICRLFNCGAKTFDMPEQELSANGARM